MFGYKVLKNTCCTLWELFQGDVDEIYHMYVRMCASALGINRYVLCNIEY